MDQLGSRIRRIFFDSGKVLVYPISGDWFVPGILADQLAELGLGSIRLGMNRMKAGAFLDRNHLVRTEDGEYEQFLEYYRILFAGIAALDGEDNVRACARAKVRDYGSYKFYSDVADSISRLSLSYRLGIISDAWPSIFGVYRAAGLFGSFEPFVVSSMHGSTKAQKTLFDEALTAVEEEPSECLFVDDSVLNCRIAAEKGMIAVVMCRGGAPMKKWGLPAVADLAGLEALLAGYA